MVRRRFGLEQALHNDNQETASGKLNDENPLDTSEDFKILCEACRRGDLKVCQEKILQGININARDTFDYTPMILASLCGHYEVVQLLLESGASCERDSFQGERCLYNALNGKIRNLLLQYDYSKSTNPLQPFAAHITSLLTSHRPKTADIEIVTADGSFHCHKFLLAARSPYFARKLKNAPNTKSWNLHNSVPASSFEAAMRFLYLDEVTDAIFKDDEEGVIVNGIHKLGGLLENERLWEGITKSSNRQLARQMRKEELSQAQEQLDSWFQENIMKHKITIETGKAHTVSWDRLNSISADVLLRADEGDGEAEMEEHEEAPIGSPSPTQKLGRSVLFPAHRAMLLRSEFFLTMFSSAFREAQESQDLHIIPIDCRPDVLQIVLRFLYTEKTDIPLDLAVDVLVTADMLFIEKLKIKAAVIISTLGNGRTSVVESENSRGEMEEEVIDIYDVLRVGWETRMPRLEEFAARYIALRLEHYIDDPDFMELVRESAARIKQRQETDTIELIDDIRFYLSERFRLRFEDIGLEEMINEHHPADNGDSSDVSAIPSDSSTPASSPPPFDTRINADGDARAQNCPVIRTLDGEIAGDEFTQDALNYQILLGKIDKLLEKLKLDA